MNQMLARLEVCRPNTYLSDEQLDRFLPILLLFVALILVIFVVLLIHVSIRVRRGIRRGRCPLLLP
jgi:hypothetical protein